MPTKKRWTPSQWVQVGGGTVYGQGTTPYQEGGWSPLWTLAGQGTSSLGKDVMCNAAKKFRRSFCDDESPPKKKKKKKTRQQEGGNFDQVAWQLMKGVGQAGAQAARAGAGKVIQSDFAQKKAMQLMSPFVEQALGTLGKKVAGQKGGFLPLLGGLIPGLIKQFGGSQTYQAGTDPYQEGGFLPLLGLGALIPGLIKQLGGGGGDSKSGTEPFQTLSMLAQEGLIPSLVKSFGGNKQGGGGRRRKHRTPKVVTGSSVMNNPTMRRMFRRQGGRNVGVLPEMISGPQVGMGTRHPRRRPGRHCFQGLP